MFDNEYIYISQKVRLMPNKSQINVLTDFFNKARFIHNLAVTYYNKKLEETGEMLKAPILQSLYLKNKPQYEFLKDVSPTLQNKIFANLSIAIGKRMTNKEANKFLFFKKKKTILYESFYLGKSEFSLVEKPNKKHHYIYFKGLGSSIKIQDKLRFKEAIPLFVTFKKELNKYYASITYKVKKDDYLSSLKYKIENNEKAIGIDLGINQFITTSCGLTIGAERPLLKSEKRLKMLYRRLDKKEHPRFKGDTTKKSNNYLKLSFKIAKLHNRIKKIRNDHLNKVSSVLVRNFAAICMEDLSVKELQKSKSFAKNEQDIAFYNLQTKIAYKSKLANHKFILANKYFASSKLCVKCGHIKEDLTLFNRVYRCPNCGFEIDRDFNAACNLFKYMKKIIGWGTSKFKPFELDKLVKDCDKNNLNYYFQSLGNNQPEIKKDALLTQKLNHASI